MKLTNNHIHIMTADHTPAIQLYYLARDIIIKILEKLPIKIHIEKIDYATKVPIGVNVALSLFNIFKYFDVQKGLDNFLSFIISVSNITTKSLKNHSVTKNLVNKRGRLKLRLIKKYINNEISKETPFKDVLAKIIESLYEINNTSEIIRTQKEVLCIMLQNIKNKPIYKRAIALSMDFDSAFENVWNPGFYKKTKVPYNMPRISFNEQLNELLTLSNKTNMNTILSSVGYPNDFELVPFMCVDPRNYFSEAELLVEVDAWVSKGVKGIKLYPPLGYLLEDKKLIELYKLCMEKNIPVLAHCNVGGAGRKGKVNCSQLSHPFYWIPVFNEIIKIKSGIGQKLKVCLGHFGTIAYDEHMSWRDEIMEVMDMYKNIQEIEIYSDISANIPTKKNSKQYFKNLKKILEDPLYGQRILYGSDFWMELYDVNEINWIENVLENNVVKPYHKQLENNAEKFLYK